MERLYASGRLLFGVAITALGVEHFICAHFPGDVVQVIPWVPAHPLLAYLTGGVLVAAGLCIAWNIRPRLAAIVLGALFLGCALVLQLPQVVQQPLDLGIRTGLFELLALIGAAWALAERLSPKRPPHGKGSAVLEGVLRSGRYLFAASSVVFGISHLLVPKFIATLIPPWFPGGLFWAYFTGLAFIAAGLSIATQRMDRWAATLLGSMFLLWFLFLHVPRLTGAPRTQDPDEWSSAFIALGMCGASWLMVRTKRTQPRTTLPGAEESSPRSADGTPLPD
jgi:uncharacterized membrane protein